MTIHTLHIAQCHDKKKVKIVKFFFRVLVLGNSIACASTRDNRYNCVLPTREMARRKTGEETQAGMHRCIVTRLACQIHTENITSNKHAIILINSTHLMTFQLIHFALRQKSLSI